MFLDRDFLDSSESSFEEDNPGTPPPYYQQSGNGNNAAYADHEFEFQEAPQTQFHTQAQPQYMQQAPAYQMQYQTQQPNPAYNAYSPPVAQSGPVKPMVKQEYDKISFVGPDVQQSQVEESRPNTMTNRPGSATAQMRAKMIEQQRQRLGSRGGVGMQVTANSNAIRGQPQYQSNNQPSGIENYIFSGQIYNEMEMRGDKNLKNLNQQSFKPYEPQTYKLNEDRKMPQPIKPQRTEFKDEDLQEEILDDSVAIRNQPSKTLQNIHKQKEEHKNQPAFSAPQPPPERPPQQYQEPVQIQFNSQPIKAPVQFMTEQPPAPQAPQHMPQPIQQPQPQIQLNQSQPQVNHQSLQQPAPSVEYSTQPPPALVPPNIQQPQGPPPQPTLPDPSTQQQAPPPQHQPEENKQEASDRRQSRGPPVNVREILNTAMADMKTFLLSPVPRGIMLQCSIRRDKSGFNRFFPKYYMHLSDGHVFLLAGKKRPKNKTSNYLITMNQRELNTKNPSYLGKLRSNFLGTEFHAFDTGLNPKARGANQSNTRKENAVVLYVSSNQQSNIMGSKGPRKMRVLVPAVNAQNEMFTWRPMRKDDGMLKNYKNGNNSGMFVFFNKPPKWNEHVQAFVLNFNGRVDRASVKNFQLIDDRDENKVYLQFGRVGDHVFNIDFQWPITPFQAFSIALSSFDYKFACE